MLPVISYCAATGIMYAVSSYQENKNTTLYGME